MRNLFRSGAVFMIIARIAFMAAAITGVKYLVTGNGSAAAGAALANAVVWLAIGIAVRRKNTK